MSAKEAGYVYSKCKKEDVIGTEQVYECWSSNEEKSDSDLNPYEYAMLNYFDLYNVHTESAEIE